MTDNAGNVSHKLLEKLAEHRAKQQKQEAEEQLDLSKWAEFVPDIELNEGGISQQELALDEFMRLIPITEAYRKWGGKSVVPSGHRKEVKVRCPNPAHPDKDPSFVMNTEKNVFNCFKCGGGDIFDIAAWYKGFPVPGYKDKAYFRDLKDSIAADYGMQIERSLAGEETLVRVAIPEQAQAPVQETLTQPTETVATVTYTPQGAAYAEPTLEEKISSGRKFEKIDWQAIVPANTFMRAYLEATTQDTCPEEYHFWSALVAVGMAAGLGRRLHDAPPVTGNLFVCYTGPTGTGKSRAKSSLMKVLAEIPYKKDDAVPHGARIVKNVQSGEIIVKLFQHEMIDPGTNKLIGILPVRMLLDSEELADIATRSSRQGNTLKGTMMDLYDCKATIESHSLANSLSAPTPFGSVITTTQNKSIREVISTKDNSSGFVNRWVFATGVAKPEKAVNDFVPDLLRAGGLLRLINKDSMDAKIITWSEPALKLWSDFFHSRVVPDKNRDKGGEVMQRIDLLLKKLFLLFTVNNRELVVSEATVSAVLSLYGYLTEAYDVIEEQVAATAAQDEEDFVLSVVTRSAQSGRFMSARDIQKVVKRHVKDTATLRRILENYCALGVLIEFAKPAGPSGGRPTKLYAPAGAVNAVAV